MNSILLKTLQYGGIMPECQFGLMFLKVKNTPILIRKNLIFEKNAQKKKKLPFWKILHWILKNPHIFSEDLQILTKTLHNFGIIPTMVFFPIFPQPCPAPQTATTSSALAAVTSPVLPLWALPPAPGDALRGVSVMRGSSSTGTPACHLSAAAASTGDATSRWQDVRHLRLGTGGVGFLGIGLGGWAAPSRKLQSVWGRGKGQLTAERTIISGGGKWTITEGVVRKNELIINEGKGTIKGEKGQRTHTKKIVISRGEVAIN